MKDQVLFRKSGLGLSIVFVLILMSTEVLGDIYQCIGKNGVLNFTDVPPPHEKCKKWKSSDKASPQPRTKEKSPVKTPAPRPLSTQIVFKEKNPFKPLLELQPASKVLDPGAGIQNQEISLRAEKLGMETRVPYLEHIDEMARKYQIDPNLVKAIIKVESNYNPNAISPKGAQGLMQLMPGTAKRFGVSDPFDPQENILGGVKYLRFLFDLFGDLKLVLAGYNAGEQRVLQHGNNVPPIAETQNYVARVLNLSGLSPAFIKFSEPIYRFIDKNGVLTFTNIPRIKNRF